MIQTNSCSTTTLPLKAKPLNLIMTILPIILVMQPKVTHRLLRITRKTSQGNPQNATRPSSRAATYRPPTHPPPQGP